MKKLFILFLLIPVICFAQECPRGSQNHIHKIFIVKRVIDGDTLLLNNGQKVRLIGLDTPEMHESDKLYRDAKRTKKDIKVIQAQGRLAYQFTKSLVEGKAVSIEFDIEHYDKYGRLLAYVYLEDNTFINAKIIEEGYAQTMTIPPNVKHQELFLNLQKQARENNRGLWKQ
ncbi:MAG: thermonuclease family protein [Candidatus Omnitrophota bacterium]